MVKQILLFIIIAGMAAGKGLYAQQKAENRIITAGSVLTEIVCELGHGDEIVANLPAVDGLAPHDRYRTSIMVDLRGGQIETKIGIVLAVSSVPGGSRSANPAPFYSEAARHSLLQLY